MLLIAQRVEETGVNASCQGINLYEYRHRGVDLGSPPAACFRDNPGELVNTRPTSGIGNGYNRVMSYLDILSPESATQNDIANAFEGFIELLHEHKEAFTNGKEFEAPVKNIRFFYVLNAEMDFVEEARCLFERLKKWRLEEGVHSSLVG